MKRKLIDVGNREVTASRIKNEWTERRVSRPENSAANELLLYGVIGSGDYWSDEPDLTGAYVLSWLNKLPAGTDMINVRINSPGGEVFEGVAIYNALLTWQAESSLRKVKVTIDSICASIAVLVSMVGDEIVIAGNGMIMVHKASNFAYGTADDFRKEADALEKVELIILNTTVSRTGSSAAEVKSWMDAETYFTADEAVEHGFADRALALKAAPVKNNMELYDKCIAANNRIKNRLLK